MSTDESMGVSSFIVIQVQEIEDRHLLILQHRSGSAGDLKGGKHLVNAKTGDEYLIRGVGLIPVEAWTQGFRAISVKLDPAKRQPEIGDVLELAANCL